MSGLIIAKNEAVSRCASCGQPWPDAQLWRRCLCAACWRNAAMQMGWRFETGIAQAMTLLLGSTIGERGNVEDAAQALRRVLIERLLLITGKPMPQQCVYCLEIQDADSEVAQIVELGEIEGMPRLYRCLDQDGCRKRFGQQFAQMARELQRNEIAPETKEAARPKIVIAR